MNALLPIGIPGFNPAIPALKSAAPAGLPLTVPEGAGTQVNSFLSLLRQSSTNLANESAADTVDDSTPVETTPTERALKNNKDLNSLLMNGTSASVVPTENQPLPFKFSLNIFGTPADSKSSRAQKSTSAAKDDSAPKETTATTPVPVAPVIPVAAPANSIITSAVTGDSTPAPVAPPNAPAGSPKPPVEQDNPRLNIDADAVEKAAPSELAFALRLQTTGQTDAVTTPAAPTPGSAPTTNGTSGTQPVVALPDARTAAPATGSDLVAQSASEQHPTVVPPDTHALMATPHPELTAHIASGQRQGAEPVDAPASAPMMRPAVAAQSTMEQQPAAAATATRQNSTAEQPALPANKSNETEPAPVNHQQTQSSPDQNPNAGSSQQSRSQDNKSDDSSRENHHGASDSTVEFSPNPAPVEVSHVATPALNSQSVPNSPAASPAASSTPAAAPSPTPAAMQSAPLTPANDETVKTGPANQISFSVPAGDNQKVEVRLMDRAGEVRVSVRAPNEELAGTLRQDLGSLTGKLNQSGYTTEAFTPSRGSAEFSRDQKNADQQQNGSERQSSGRNQQQQSSQQESRGKRPAWLDEFENSLAT